MRCVAPSPVGSGEDFLRIRVEAAKFFMDDTESESMISQSIFKAYDIRGVIGKLSVLHISEPTRLGMVADAVLCL